MKDILQKSPKFAFPFTILHNPNTVRLIAGEDYRYTLSGSGLDTWLPSLLSEIDGSKSVNELINKLDESLKPQVLNIFLRLYGERVLVDNVLVRNHSKEFQVMVFGSGKIYDLLEQVFTKDNNNKVYKENKAYQIVKILCQDRLDYYEILRFNQENLTQNFLSLWVSYGAMTRGFVSPIFFPQVGACLACLIYQFKHLSPIPEIYDELIEHSKESKAIAPVTFSQYGIEVLKQLVLWKISLLKEVELPSAIYRLHVLEANSLEVSSHQVFIDPNCPQCRQGV